MRIKSIKATNVAPVKLFQVDDLSDVVVIAGPNGVGKSRLIQGLLAHIQNLKASPNMQIIVEATSTEESELWGGSTLDTSDPAQADILKHTIQRNQHRRNWKSGVMFFESDRSLQQIKPYAFTWDLADPAFESIAWNSTLGGIKSRYEDTIHSIFRLIEHQKRSIANRAVELRKEGKTVMNLEFDDPLEPFKQAFSQLLSPKVLLNPSTQNQQLQYESEGKAHNINSLSSGEREVVNIVFDFILRKPDNCIVIFDEPELHLHPELSYKLIQTLKSVGQNNQFVLCTHSPDLISSSLNNSVVFLAPSKDDDFNQAIPVTEDDETNQALRLLGHSIGIVALGRKLVLIEGRESSLDKQVYGAIIKSKFPGLVLVPTGGKDEIRSFSTLFEAVLSKTIWGVEFFMLTDRDTIPPFPELDPIERGSPRLKLLKKYHLENYFLDETVWSRVFADMEPAGSWLMDPVRIREQMKEIARDSIAYATSLTVSELVRTRAGNVDIMIKGAQRMTLLELQNQLVAKAVSEGERVRMAMEESQLRRHVKESFEKLSASIDGDTDEWKDLIPGRPIMNQFIAKSKLQKGRARQLYIKEVEKAGLDTFNDIIEIFDIFSRA